MDKYHFPSPRQLAAIGRGPSCMQSLVEPHSTWPKILASKVGLGCTSLADNMQHLQLWAEMTCPDLEIVTQDAHGASLNKIFSIEVKHWEAFTIACIKNTFKQADMAFNDPSLWCQASEGVFYLQDTF